MIATMRQVADSECQRVGLIMVVELQAEERVRHSKHLRFFCSAIPCKSQFDRCWRVLGNGQPGARAGGKGNTARLPEHQRRTG